MPPTQYESDLLRQAADRATAGDFEVSNDLGRALAALLRATRMPSTPSTVRVRAVAVAEHIVFQGEQA